MENSAQFSYKRFDWGDCIAGSKEQLQALGLGVGMAFPGEPGGPVRSMTVADPRGFSTRIEVRDGKAFCAYVHFSNWPKRPTTDRLNFAPGVTVRKESHGDVFEGSAEALVDAGIVLAGQFPGMPGMRLHTVRIFADGRLIDGPKTANVRGWNTAGAKDIERGPRGTYIVTVRIDDDEKKMRWAAEREREEAWRLQVRALPRPAMLRPKSNVQIMPAPESDSVPLSLVPEVASEVRAYIADLMAAQAATGAPAKRRGNLRLVHG